MEFDIYAQEISFPAVEKEVYRCLKSAEPAKALLLLAEKIPTRCHNDKRESWNYSKTFMFVMKAWLLVEDPDRGMICNGLNYAVEFEVYDFYNYRKPIIYHVEVETFQEFDSKWTKKVGLQSYRQTLQNHLKNAFFSDDPDLWDFCVTSHLRVKKIDEIKNEEDRVRKILIALQGNLSEIEGEPVTA